MPVLQTASAFPQRPPETETEAFSESSAHTTPVLAFDRWSCRRGGGGSWVGVQTGSGH